MDVVMYGRILAHLLAVTWFAALFFLAHASEGRIIHITHTRVGRAAIVLLAAWFALLLLTVRGVQVLPREVVVPTLASLELGGWSLAWVWLAWCGSENYRIEFKRNNRTSVLIIVLLTVLFLG